jgi:putative Ca2+/H+ antiporter (TMEM165/GDT1 family)
MAGWTLIPDKLDDVQARPARFGVFGATLIAFFLAEMGDKTQVATIALAAKYDNLVAVVAGTTLGMMLADVPAVLFGDRVSRKLPIRLIHGVAAAIFAVIGIGVLVSGHAVLVDH